MPLFQKQQALGFSFIFASVGEIIIGLIIGFVAAIPFWATDSAGYLIDTMRGSSMGNVYNPTLAESSTLIGVFFSQLLNVIFFSCGGINALITALYQSYTVLPAGTGVSFYKGLFDFLLEQWDMLFTIFLRLTLPAAGIMLITDIGMGLLNRSAQQLNVFFLAMSIKSVLALLILIIALPFLLKYLNFDVINNILQTVKAWQEIS